ncbi:hypothetical protein WJX73_003974 [Symbiochloris irregularis]|uniref:Protein kinase domain-containing protein n=1 Tax=Symbiochloris irregularis TaxID=706552 RepID=A0AAW1NRE3_9CHLO
MSIGLGASTTVKERPRAASWRWPNGPLLPCLLLLVFAGRAEGQFVNVRGYSRLIFTVAGLQQAINDPNAGLVSLAGDIYLNESTWNEGAASLNRPLLIQGAAANRRRIDFGGVTNAITIQANGNLTFQDLIISGTETQNGISLKDYQTLPRMGGLAQWPSIVADVGSVVNFLNVTAYYYEPQATLTCQQYVSKLVFGLPTNVSYNLESSGTVFDLPEKLVAVQNVTNPYTNQTLGSATQESFNTTNICIEDNDVPPPPPGAFSSSSSSSLSGGAVAGIAIGAAVGVAAVAALLAFFLIRRRRRQRAAKTNGADLAKNGDGEALGQQDLSNHSHLPPGSHASGGFSSRNTPPPGMTAALLGTANSGKGPRGSGHSPASSLNEMQSLQSFGAPGSGGPGNERRVNVSQTMDQATIAGLLRHRSSGGLAGVEVGPLLGRGSYGRVYKGRWKGVAVAIKVVDHMTAAGNAVDAARESVLSTSVQHPNVVVTYKICTIHLNDMPTAEDAQQQQQQQQMQPAPSGAISIGSQGKDAVPSAGQLQGQPSVQSVSPTPETRAAARVAMEKSDSAKVSQGKTPGTSPPGTAGDEQPRGVNLNHPSPGNSGPLDAHAKAALDQTPSGGMDAGQGVSVEALMATRPTPVGVVMSASSPKDWDSDEEHDEEYREEKRKQPAITETWMLLEYCDRGNLDSGMRNGRFKVKSTGDPDLVCIYRCLIDIAAGMDYLHSVGVLHGDLKAANVLCKSTGTDPRGFTCKLADFGLSRLLDPTMTHVSTKSYGTISYMPAEVLKDGRLTTAADVYSFALMMWEMYTNTALFEGQTMAQVFYLVCYEQYRPPIPEGMPEEYAELMRQCWSQDFESRPGFSAISPRLQAMYAQLRSNSRGGGAAGGGIPPAPRPSSQSVGQTPFAGATTPAQTTPSQSPGVTPTAQYNAASAPAQTQPTGNNADSPSKAAPASPFGAAAHLPRADSQPS